MNFYIKNSCWPKCRMRKLLLVMKITTFLITVCIMQVSASSFAQKITLNQKGITIESLFREISKQTGYSVFYSDKKIDQNRRIDAHFKDTPLEEVLNVSFKDQPVKFTISDQSVLIERKEPTFLERLANRWASIDASGRVVDSENRPLPGASVKVKKTGKGVSTDKDGRFSLRGVEEGAVLVVSFIGYLPKEVSASANMGSVVLEQSLSKLDEVQVIAYGTTTQRLSTGNVTTIKADVIEKHPVNNPLLALQGRVPGLFIEQATGFAGTGVKVRIQGQNSLNNGNDPLYVIDGIPYLSQLLPVGNSVVGGSGGAGDSRFSVGNPMSFINPADIESIDVLKDADATAIYGSRAANGAILITTKKGKAGDIKVGLNLQFGWAKVPRKLKLMNSQEYLEMRREALKNDGIASPATGSFGDSDLNGNWDNARNVDWQKELIGGTAGYQDLNGSISGGDERTTFLTSVSQHRETDVFPGSYSDNKTSVHFNINSISINQKFRIQFSGSYLFDNNQLPFIDLTERAMMLIPLAPALYQSDGSINWEPDASGNSTFFANPIRNLNDTYVNKTYNLTGNISLSYQIIPGMEIRSNFGYTKLTSNVVQKSLLQSSAPEYLQYNSRTTSFTNNNSNSWSIEPQLTYNRNIKRGKLEVLIGATFYKSNDVGSSLAAIGFSNDLVMEDIFSATRIEALSSPSFIYKYNAVFSRINFNWQDKYILNLTGRRDGSSRFGPKSQFHNFAAVGAAWIFSNEKLIKNHLSFLSFGKLRMSYGTTGSDQISNYRFLSLYEPLQQSMPYQGINTYQPNSLTNPNLEWEETRKLQIGLDLGFSKERILLNVSYYRNRSSNQLGNYAFSSTTGFSGIAKNLTDQIENSGWELGISSRNLFTKVFKWSTNLNLTIPKSLLSSSTDSRFPFINIVGQPLTSRKIYHFLGVDPANGVYQFEDRNGNPTSSPNDPLDRIVLVDLAPKFYGGIQNSFSYKGFQLDFLFSFVKQIAQNPIFGINGVAGYNLLGTGNQLASLLDRWQKPGDISLMQKFTSGYSLNEYWKNANESDAIWKDASYIRLKNISFSWRLPTRWSQGVHLQNCNLFVQGQNLWTLTNYKGLDPETKSSSTLPPLKVITLGLKVIL